MMGGPTGFVCGSGTPAPVIRVLAQLRECCVGAAEDGPDACTCWVAEYDLDQQPLVTETEPATRTEMCADCAYRPESPERQGDDRYQASNTGELERVARTAVFWCHQGIRKPVRWRHTTLGVVVEADTDAYEPPMGRGGDEDAPYLVPYKADGTPADRCAGWAARHAVYARATGDEPQER